MATDCHLPSPTRAALTLALLLLLSSCTASSLSPMDYSVCQAQHQNRALALDAAEAALIDLGYAIERRDLAEGVITTQPTEAHGGLDSTHSSRLSSQGKTRRIVEVRVQEDDGVTKLFCKVIIQEQSTEEHRMFASDRSSSDSPGDNTAINRDAATTAAQNTVWRTLRRDKTAEREVLAVITERTR